MKNQTYKTQRKITLVGQNASTDGVLTDISILQIGVLAQRGAREGTELECQFELPALGLFQNLKVNATVTHRHNLKNDVYLKLNFVKLSDQEHAIITDFLAYKQRLIDMGKKHSISEELS